jgi:methionine synthase II (cobalamin-independent)
MKKKINFTPEIEIEDLVNILPESITYLRKKGIRCLRCGEPIWGSLKDAALEKGFSDEDIQKFILDLNQLNRK